MLTRVHLSDGGLRQELTQQVGDADSTILLEPAYLSSLNVVQVAKEENHITLASLLVYLVQFILELGDKQLDAILVCVKRGVLCK